MVRRHPRKTLLSQSLEGPSTLPKPSLKATLYQRRSREEPILEQSPLSSPIQLPGGCNHGCNHINPWRHNCDTSQWVLTLHYWCPSCPRLLENVVCEPPGALNFKVHLVTEAPESTMLFCLSIWPGVANLMPSSSEWRLQNTAVICGVEWSLRLYLVRKS